MRTQVAIIGAGPAGLLLGHLLRQAGIDTIIVERQTRAHVEGRIRAGVLERTTTGLVERLGLAERLRREGRVETGFNLADGERLIRIAVEELTGKQLVVYGQTELTKDLIEAAPGRSLEIVWEARDVAIHEIESDRPFLTFVQDAIRAASIAISSRAATAITAPRGARSRPPSRGNMSESIHSAGSASWRMCRPAITN